MHDHAPFIASAVLLGMVPSPEHWRLLMGGAEKGPNILCLRSSSWSCLSIAAGLAEAERRFGVMRVCLGPLYPTRTPLLNALSSAEDQSLSG